MPAPTHPVLIVGSMAFDDLELPSGTFKDVVGGSATYCSMATTLFSPARIVAVVGDDFPAATLKDLAARNVDIAGVERARGKTFRWAGRYAKDLSSRETLDTQLNVFADFRPKLPASYADSRYLLLGNIHPELQLEVLDQAAQRQFVAADTMNFWIEGERASLAKVLAKIDMLIINDEELRLLSQEHNLKKGAQKVLKMGPRRLIVKRGDAGALLFDGDNVFFSPAMPLEHEIDPTGCGDTFAGALLGALAQAGEVNARTLRRAVLSASAVASFCVQDVGTRSLQRIEDEHYRQRLDDLVALTST